MRGILKNPFVESVVGDHTQLFTEGFIIIAHDYYCSRGYVFFLDSLIFLLIVCADFELGAERLPSDGLWWPGSGSKGRLVFLGFSLMQ